MRLDRYLVEQNGVESRTRAQNLIELGYVSVNQKIADKPSYEVKEKDEVTVIMQYDASLGGIKLREALRHHPLPIKNADCMDIGASNGGFCDVLLQNGARRVIALDVGECALPERMKTDERIFIKDKTNARFITPEDLPFLPDYITADVSFISITQILPNIYNCLQPGGIAVCLIKPQFECGKKALSKKGMVIDAKAEQCAVLSVEKFAMSLGFRKLDFCPAPRPFEKKNQEYLIFLQK